MRYALEVTGALGGGGYRRYVERVTHALARAAPEDEFVLFGAYWGGYPERGAALDLPRLPNVRVELWRAPQALWLPGDELGLGLTERRLRSWKADLVHGLCSVTPPVRSLPAVVTLHYAGHWPFTGLWNRFYFHRLTDRSVRGARRVIAISKFTLAEARLTWPLPDARWAVVPHGGPGAEFSPGAGAAPDGLKPPFVLAVGALRAPKNPRVVVESFAAFLKEHPDAPHSLAFAGGGGEAAAETREAVSRLGLDGRVRFLGPVEPARIPDLYRAAWAVVCASTTEGFAFPALEAMACGVPVLAADAGALPETVGEAGLLCRPDAGGFAAGLARLHADPGLRQRLAAAGAARAAAFSWEETARRTLAVYRSVLGECAP